MKEIELTRGLKTIVDDDVYEWASKVSWYAHFGKPDYYARATFSIYEDGRVARRKNVFLHRMVLETKNGQEVDHINGNKLDNRRENLRVCTRSQNAWNAGTRRKGRPKGVYLRKDGRWVCVVGYKNASHHVGSFDNEEDAVKAREIAAKKLHGEFYHP